ncbi:MAG: hypothetical protein CFE26_24345 [Verrucomicrobiales bacterium VVV1]|nr:MAG: hypothetical protein CFE26_24345 [Verrucomicrobiales bacterium VVV1]
MVEILHSAATWGLVGVIWIVQLVIYPQFATVGEAAFRDYHADDTRRITWVVGPLMLAEVATAAVLLGRGDRPFWLVVSLAPLAICWLSTACLQVPLHNRLARGFETKAHRALVRSNWIRTVAWTVRGAQVAFGLA